MITNNKDLLTKSEGLTGKDQTKFLLYWPSGSEVSTARPRFDIFSNSPVDASRFYSNMALYTFVENENMFTREQSTKS